MVDTEAVRDQWHAAITNPPSPRHRVLTACAGADVVGVDWRVPLDEAARRVGPGYSLQGNLDPAVLLSDRETIDREVRRIVEQGRAARGHVFNLGHGVLPDTDPGALTHVVELVHELTAR